MVKDRVQAVTLHKDDETVVKWTSVKSSQGIGCNEHDYFFVTWMVRALRTDVRKYRMVERRVEYLRLDRARVDAVDSLHQQTRVTRERIPHDRLKRYTNAATIKQPGTGTREPLKQTARDRDPRTLETKRAASTSGVYEAETETTSMANSRISYQKACVVDRPGHSKERRECSESIFRKEDEEKTTREATDAAATSATLLIEAATSLTNPSTTTATSSCVEQFVDMEVGKVDLEDNELEEMSEGGKVRRVGGLAVRYTDIVGTAQVDYEIPNSRIEFEQKADEELDVMRTHEDELIDYFEIPISEIDIVGEKSGVVSDSLKVQGVMQDEIDCIARYEVVGSVRMIECKQRTCAGCGWIENGKGYIVHYCIDGKQVNCDQERDARQTIVALLIFFLLLFSTVDFIMLIFCDSGVVLSVMFISRGDG